MRLARDSYNGNGGRVACWQFWNARRDKIESGFNNAFWLPLPDNYNQFRNFFFGYDYTGKRTETGFDSCAHELTHGVTYSTAALEYEGELGAANLNATAFRIFALGIDCFRCQTAAKVRRCRSLRRARRNPHPTSTTSS